jgi:hypothetical protein
MRSLEVHLFETETDVDYAIASGTLLPEQLASTKCVDCGERVGYVTTDFEPFVVVIDENDQDWVVCCECSRPIVSHVDAFYPPVTKSHFARIDEHLDDDDDFQF